VQRIVFCSMEKQTNIINCELNYLYSRIFSAVKSVEFVSERISYIALRVRWCNIIVLNEPASSKGKCDESTDRIYEELEHIFDHFPKYRMKILLWDFNATLGK